MREEAPLSVSGLTVAVERKPIRRVYLHVRSEDGSVFITAPPGVPREELRRFVIKDLGWIRSRRLAIQRREPPAPVRFETGETVSLWGRACRLEVRSASRPAMRFLPEEGRVVLYLRPGSTTEDRAQLLREGYRFELRQALPPLVRKWERITGLHAREWRTKAMKTRWGSCNIQAKRIWLNVALAKYPRICLEGVILHELIHLVCRYHDAAFYELMSRYLPEWKEIRHRLNG